MSLLLNPKLPVTVHTSVSFGKPGAGELAQVCSCVSWTHDEQLSGGGVLAFLREDVVSEWEPLAGRTGSSKVEVALVLCC